METVYANCRTPGCANNGIAIPLLRTEGVCVTCGACDNPVVNLTDTPPETPKEMPTWEL